MSIESHTEIVTTTAMKQELPLYKQAAAQTGFTVEVTGREGEPYTFWGFEKGDKGLSDSNRLVQRTITISPGYVAVAITRPPDQRNHVRFWDTLDCLVAEAERQNPK